MEVENINAWEDALYTFLDSSKPEVLATVTEKWDDDSETALKAAIDEFASTQE
jgi:F0F1-type ATP synthase alpha subunit